MKKLTADEHFEKLRKDGWHQAGDGSWSKTAVRPVPQELSAVEPERPAGPALVETAPGKTPGHEGAHSKPAPVLEIQFVLFARRPLDWDNYSLKQLQDCLVEVGILAGDGYDQLQGSVRSIKVRSIEEEGTLVCIKTP